MSLRLLDAASRNAFVWYYRCQSCGHVWTVEKEDGETIGHVTPLLVEPVTLSLFCPECGQPTNIHVVRASGHASDLMQFWECPWCHAPDAAQLPGRIAHVARRYPSSRRRYAKGPA
jgi:ssDNA-binding Zn-finger/Zn-ribbon topoisomerase 1